MVIYTPSSIEEREGKTYQACHRVEHMLWLGYYRPIKHEQNKQALRQNVTSSHQNQENLLNQSHNLISILTSISRHGMHKHEDPITKTGNTALPPLQ